MCFSEVASYTVAAACAAAGTYSISRSPSPKYLPVAVIPLAFAIQQAGEGMVWHALDHGAASQASGAWPTIFTFFATVFWPVFIPFAVFAAEEDRNRKRTLSGLVFAGSLVSFYYIVRMLNTDITANAAGHSVQYISQIKAGTLLPGWLLSGAQGGSDWILVPYAIATIASLAVSSLLPLRVFAGLVAISLIVFLQVNQVTLISVWCFFAAAGSILIIPAINAARSKARLANARPADRTVARPVDCPGEATGRQGVP